MSSALTTIAFLVADKQDVKYTIINVYLLFMLIFRTCAVLSFVFRSALLSQLPMHLLDVITQRPFPGATFTHFSL